MPSVASFRYKRGDREYELAISWDDEAFSEGSIHFEIDAKSWHVENPNEPNSINASVTIEADDEGVPYLVAQVEGKQFARIALADLLDESQILDRIPAWVFGGEPVAGCLIRSGLSATVGQTIECKNMTAEAHWLRERLMEMARCLRIHLPDMTSKAALRAMRCIARAGF